MKKVITSFVVFFALSATVTFAQEAKKCSGEQKACCKAGAAEAKSCCKSGDKAVGSADAPKTDIVSVKYSESAPAREEKKVIRRVKAKGTKMPANASAKKQ